MKGKKVVCWHCGSVYVCYSNCNLHEQTLYGQRFCLCINCIRNAKHNYSYDSFDVSFLKEKLKCKTLTENDKDFLRQYIVLNKLKRIFVDDDDE